MKNILKNTLALSDKGGKDLSKAILLSILCDFMLMATSGIIYIYLKDSLIPALENKTPIYSVGVYITYAIVMLLLLYICYNLQYKALYVSVYNESATKRISLAEKMRQLPLSFFGKRDISELTTVMMNDTTMLETAFSHYIPPLISNIISTLLISIGLIVLNWEMAIATIWVIPISFLFCYLSKKKQDNIGIKAKLDQLLAADKIQEIIDNVKDIKSNNRKESHIAIANECFDKVEKSSARVEFVLGTYVGLAQMILKLGVSTSMLAGIYLLSIGGIDILTFLLFLIVATRLFDPLSVSLINLSATFLSMLSIDRMKEVENTPIQDGALEINNNGYDITFKDVCFAYEKGDRVLNGISFTANQGEVTALIGPSGGGKSTTIKLAARFWDISEGVITLGGSDISKVNPDVLLKNYSIVFQDVTLFNNTIMENIRMGRIDASDKEVLEAAIAANCHSFIENLPDGYGTFVGENGSLLSGGERQRISIARALLKDSPVILLDEATSSLDVMTETLLQEAIVRLTKDKTVIIIAHRMRTIAGANKIVLLKNGKVSQIGTHNELINQENSDYAKMVELQTQSQNWKL